MNNDTPSIHKTVLLNEVVQYLDPQPGKLYVDATLGGGGHTRAILQKEPNCRVIGLDWDQQSLVTYGDQLVREFGERFIPLWGNFANITSLLREQGISQVDGILADFGTSQMQIFERAGFSFSKDSPLDMRMSPAHQKTTAADIINRGSESLLRDIFWKYGEERFSRKIAEAIVEIRGKKEFKTTRDLASFIEKIIRVTPGARIHPATRVFQALRIFINKELDNIESLLAQSCNILAQDGRLVCISFHSLEDRIVKHFLLEQASHGQFEVLTKKAVEATPEEVNRNASSRSAKLRAARRIRAGGVGSF